MGCGASNPVEDDCNDAQEKNKAAPEEPEAPKAESSDPPKAESSETQYPNSRGEYSAMLVDQIQGQEPQGYIALKVGDKVLAKYPRDVPYKERKTGEHRVGPWYAATVTGFSRMDDGDQFYAHVKYEDGDEATDLYDEEILWCPTRPADYKMERDPEDTLGVGKSAFVVNSPGLSYLKPPSPEEIAEEYISNLDEEEVQQFWVFLQREPEVCQLLSFSGDEGSTPETMRAAVQKALREGWQPGMG